MRCVRAYQDAPLQVGGKLLLDACVTHHWLHVLRLQAGHAVSLFNGDGYDYQGELQLDKHSSNKRSASVLLQQQHQVSADALPRVRLFQGLSRAERMDWVMQKATELGIDAIVPLQCQHSQLQLRGSRLGKRMQHWQQVIISACEQSGRACLPQLQAPLAPADLPVNSGPGRLQLVLHPDAAEPLHRLLTKAGQPLLEVDLCIGPEGGFSALELQQLQRLGFVTAALGQTILRTETAAVAALALLKLSGY